MRFKIKKYSGEIAGTLFVHADGDLEFESGFDPVLKDSILSAVKRGITVMQCVYNREERSHTLVNKSVAPSDELYPSALREMLEGEGYLVETAHPELEQKIKQCLSDIPDSNPVKTGLLEELAGMDFYRQAYILSEFEKLGYNKA